MSLGKLKKTLSERCPDCKSNLTLRTVQVEAIEDGEEILLNKDVIVCDVADCI